MLALRGSLLGRPEVAGLQQCPAVLGQLHVSCVRRHSRPPGCCSVQLRDSLCAVAAQRCPCVLPLWHTRFGGLPVPRARVLRVPDHGRETHPSVLEN